MKKIFTKTSNIAMVLFAIAFPLLIHAQQDNNLITDPGNLNDNLSSWNISANGGSGWRSYSSEGVEGTAAWVTSYSFGYKSQTIDLVAKGYTTSFLDSEPIVSFSEMYKGRDNGSSTADSYQLRVQLLDANMNIIDQFNSGIITTSSQWQQMKGTFSDYGSGLRYIYYEHGGKGADNWSGNYGCVIDDCFLAINNHVQYTTGITGTLSGWSQVVNGGDGWGFNQNNRWVTSYFECSKTQIIDLQDMGYTISELNAAPRIDFSEWYLGSGPQTDDSYFCDVRLLDANMNIVDSYSNNATADSFWKNSSHSFSNYGSGVRYVEITHGGQDSEFWAGHYGTVIDATWIRVTKTAVTGISDFDDTELGLSISPNPSRGLINIETTNLNPGMYQMEVYDLNGRSHYSGNLDLGANSFYPMDLTRLSPGTYVVVFIGDEKTTQTKLIIQ